MKKKKFLTIMKKYGYYLIAGVLLIAIGLSIAFATNNNFVIDPNDNDNVDVGGQTLTFTFPMQDFTVLKEYSDSELMYNKTMKQWEAHKSYDLTSESLNVFAIAKGVVSEVKNDMMLGNYIVITHPDGYKSIYASLDTQLNVAQGDNVEKGQLIGKASTTATREEEDGAHLHFELLKNNAKINPATVLDFEGK